MAQPRRKTHYWYGFPEVTKRGAHVTAVYFLNKEKPEWVDNLAVALNCAAWYRWERRQLRHYNLTHGKHTQRARKAK